MITLFIILAILLGALGVLLVIQTPLRSLLPGYLNNNQRDEYISTVAHIDSLSNEIDIRNIYLDNINAILHDQIDTVLPSIPTDSIPAIIPIDSLILPSENEREFVRRYQQNEKFNIAVLSPIAAHGFTFINPLQGAEARFPEEGEDERRVTFDLPRTQPVSSIYRGTVLDLYNTIENGYTIIVQHPNDFLSRYSGLTEVFVQRGQQLNPGMRIGLIERDKTEKFANPPSLELWYNGTAVNPRNYIPF